MKEFEKIITKDWEKINPQNIEDYLNIGGYQALKKYIKEIDSNDHLKIIEEIKNSGLVGRGGAGFPTGQKIEAVFNEKEKERYLICNLDESEPGTFKDRMLAENNLHLLLEGMIILALIIKAKKAFIYLNGNFFKAKEILEKAISEAEKKNFLGDYILGLNDNLEIEIFSGAGAYVCGEETALINSLEGNRGEPKHRPPYPTQVGLFGKPTLINNAETISNIPWITLNGGEAYSQIGSKVSPGMKLYSIGGAVEKSGLYEAPTGISIFEAIDLAGGVKRGKDFWFAQIGGSAGKLALTKDLEEKLEYSKDSKISLGSGAILVVDKSCDIHDLLMSWTGFFRRESCGKCVPCREGTFRLYEIAKRLQDGEISERDEQAIEDILFTLENSTYCPLGKFSVVAFRDAMENFKEEIFKKK